LNILSVQSWVAYGHVGNAAALFPLQRLGAEVWAVHTTAYSNHPGYGALTGAPADPALVEALLEGVAARGAFERCDGMLSGYAPSAACVGAIARAAAQVRSANPRALYCCDPVLGDAGRLYVPEAAAAALRDEAIPQADIATPNAFELEWLTGGSTARLGDACAAARALAGRMRAGGTDCVLVTSLRTEATPADALDLLAVEGDAAFLLRTPALPIAANGAGDLMAALFLFHRLATGDVRRALETAAASVFGVLRRTAAAGVRELLIVEAQEELLAPTQRFGAARV
jgi:pyridoxine kinase